MPIHREQILKAERDLMEGIRQSDVSYLSRVLHDDLLFLIPNGQVITKEMDLDSHRRGDMVVESLVPTFEDIRIIGDSATVVVVYDTRGSMLGNPIQGRFRYIRVWKECEGVLKVTGGACFGLN